MTEVLLVGYQDQGNLGMGYLASVLDEHGHTVELIDVRDGPEAVAKRVRETQPLVVGFSLIFQFFLPQFRDVATLLRAQGVTSHFTIGGHYASLCPTRCSPRCRSSTASPSSRVSSRSSTSSTHLAAGRRLARGAWSRLPQRSRDDREPGPARWWRTSTPCRCRCGRATPSWSSASRPCRCWRAGAARGAAPSAPSTPFTGRRRAGRPGPVRRRVADEMRMLYDERPACAIFLFQDDDFPLSGRAGGRVGGPSRRPAPRAAARRQDALEDQLSRRVRRARAVRAAA